MTNYTIWLDTEHAKAFLHAADGAESVPVATQHHDGPHGHMAKQRDTALMFKELAAIVHNAEKILLVGPGQAKSQFSHYLAEHNALLSKKVVGCEPMEQSSDAQIQAFGRKFFDTSAHAANE